MCVPSLYSGFCYSLLCRSNTKQQQVLFTITVASFPGLPLRRPGNSCMTCCNTVHISCVVECYSCFPFTTAAIMKWNIFMTLSMCLTNLQQGCLPFVTQLKGMLLSMKFLLPLASQNPMVHIRTALIRPIWRCMAHKTTENHLLNRQN